MQPSRVSAGSLWPLNQGPRTGANERTALRPSPRSGAFPYTRKPDGLRRGLNSCALRAPGKRTFGRCRERSTAVLWLIYPRSVHPLKLG
jgi:hypothetical protein